MEILVPTELCSLHVAIGIAGSSEWNIDYWPTHLCLVNI